MQENPLEVQQARDALLDAYRQNREYANGEDRRRTFHRPVLRNAWEVLATHLATYFGWRLPMTPEQLGMGLPHKRGSAPPKFERYFNDLLDCSQRWGLLYNWAPTELMYRDFFEYHPALQVTADKKVWADVATALGLPAYIEVKIPTLGWKHAPKKEILKSLERQLQARVPRAAKVRTKYKLEQVAQWVVERNIGKLSAEDLLMNKWIGEAIRTFEKLAGGRAPRRRGAPKGKRQRHGERP